MPDDLTLDALTEAFGAMRAGTQEVDLGDAFKSTI